jgi:hypothetical protein
VRARRRRYLTLLLWHRAMLGHSRTRRTRPNTHASCWARPRRGPGHGDAPRCIVQYVTELGTVVMSSFGTKLSAAVEETRSLYLKADG